MRRCRPDLLLRRPCRPHRWDPRLRLPLNEHSLRWRPPRRLRMFRRGYRGAMGAARPSRSLCIDDQWRGGTLRHERWTARGAAGSQARRRRNAEVYRNSSSGITTANSRPRLTRGARSYESSGVLRPTLYCPPPERLPSRPSLRFDPRAGCGVHGHRPKRLPRGPALAHNPVFMYMSDAFTKPTHSAPPLPWT